MRTLVAIVGAWLALGCNAAPTQLLVVVGSDLDVPAELDELSILVTHPDGVETRQSMAALGPGQLPLPRSLAIVHEGGPLGAYRVAVEGRLAGVAQLERVGELGFVPGEIRVWRVTLDRACRGVSCPDGTCAAGACRALAIGEAELEPYVPDGARDGGVDGGVDAAVSDAGSACAPSCAIGPCTCEGGCTCALGCGPADCAPTCRGAGTSCTIDASPGLGTNASCESGASCTVDASGSSGFGMECSGAATVCDVDCSSSTGCSVSCRMGADCTLHCGSATGCELRMCPGGPTSCADGVVVCGTACP